MLNAIIPLTSKYRGFNKLNKLVHLNQNVDCHVQFATKRVDKSKSNTTPFDGQRASLTKSVAGYTLAHMPGLADTTKKLQQHCNTNIGTMPQTVFVRPANMLTQVLQVLYQNIRTIPLFPNFLVSCAPPPAEVL